MIEEIADSVTLLGMVAAGVGLCVVLFIMWLHHRERRGEGAKTPEGVTEIAPEALPPTPVKKTPAVPPSAFKTYQPVPSDEHREREGLRFPATDDLSGG